MRRLASLRRFDAADGATRAAPVFAAPTGAPHRSGSEAATTSRTSTSGRISRQGETSRRLLQEPAAEFCGKLHRAAPPRHKERVGSKPRPCGTASQCLFQPKGDLWILDQGTHFPATAATGRTPTLPRPTRPSKPSSPHRPPPARINPLPLPRPPFVSSWQNSLPRTSLWPPVRSPPDARTAASRPG